MRYMFTSAQLPDSDEMLACLGSTESAKKLSADVLPSLIDKLEAQMKYIAGYKRLSFEKRDSQIKDYSQTREMLIRVLLDQLREDRRRAEWKKFITRVTAALPNSKVVLLKPKHIQ